MSRLPKNLQIVNLRRVFIQLNPMSDPDLVDWEHEIDETLNYHEQLENLKDSYPEFRWTMRDDYESYYKDYLREEASGIGYSLTRYDGVKKIERLERENGKLKNRQEKIAVKAPITEEEAYNKVLGLPPVIIDDLKRKALVVAGEAGWGKTTLVKTIADVAMRRGWIVKCFDLSLAWWHDSPMQYRMVARDWGSPPNQDGTVYDMAAITSQDRRNLVSRMIYEDWMPRYEGLLDDQNYTNNVPRILFIFEEGNTYFDSSSLNRKDWSAQVFHDFISTRRNYNLDAVLVTTRVQGEVSPKIRNRCNYLLAKLMGQEERNYISKATTKEAVERATQLQPYKFLYCGSEQILKPFGVEYRNFGQPQDLQLWTPPQYTPRRSEKRGFFSRLLNL